MRRVNTEFLSFILLSLVPFVAYFILLMLWLGDGKNTTDAEKMYSRL